MVTSAVEWQEGLLSVGYSQAATCAFFTNLASQRASGQNCAIASEKTASYS